MKKILGVASQLITGAGVLGAAFLYRPEVALAATNGDTESAAYIVIVLMMIAVGLVFYFLPTIIASSRDVPFTFVIFLLNLFFGWTLFVWLVILVWSVTAVSRAQDAFYRRHRND